MSHKEAAEEESDSDSDAESRPSGTLEESSKSKPLQNSPTSLKRSEIKKGKKSLIGIVSQDVVEMVYKDKISDLHLGEWKEVMDACLKRTGAGRSTIYTHMRQKLDALHKTEQELELDLSIPLEEQDPIIKQNLLSKKKRKNDHDLHD
ncbi:hypothetical protein Tco_1225877 [Tanacetum coccineum]